MANSYIFGSSSLVLKRESFSDTSKCWVHHSARSHHTDRGNLHHTPPQDAHVAAALQQLTVRVISPYAIGCPPPSNVPVRRKRDHCSSVLVRPEALKIFFQWLSLVRCGCQAQLKIAGPNPASASISSHPPHLYHRSVFLFLLPIYLPTAGFLKHSNRNDGHQD
jgi:hypothetical protein